MIYRIAASLTPDASNPQGRFFGTRHEAPDVGTALAAVPALLIAGGVKRDEVVDLKISPVIPKAEVSATIRGKKQRKNKTETPAPAAPTAAPSRRK